MVTVPVSIRGAGLRLDLIAGQPSGANPHLASLVPLMQGLQSATLRVARPMTPEGHAFRPPLRTSIISLGTQVVLTVDKPQPDGGREAAGSHFTLLFIQKRLPTPLHSGEDDM
jgi:hypothetical protein